MTEKEQAAFDAMRKALQRMVDWASNTYYGIDTTKELLAAKQQASAALTVAKKVQAAPAAREPLSDEQIKAIAFNTRYHGIIDTCRAIEAAHGIGKENT